MSACMMQAFQKEAMEHTPIPQASYESLGAGGHRSAWGTWFEVTKPWSVMNSTIEVIAQSSACAHAPLHLVTLQSSRSER